MAIGHTAHHCAHTSLSSLSSYILALMSTLPKAQVLCYLMAHLMFEFGATSILVTSPDSELSNKVAIVPLLLISMERSNKKMRPSLHLNLICVLWLSELPFPKQTLRGETHLYTFLRILSLMVLLLSVLHPHLCLLGHSPHLTLLTHYHQHIKIISPLPFLEQTQP